MRAVALLLAPLLLGLVGHGAGAAHTPAVAPAVEPGETKAQRAERERLEALVEEYALLEGRSAEDLARQDAILAELDGVALDAKSEKVWRKFLTETWEDGPKLSKKQGKHYLWEDEELGLFYLGGKTKKPKGLLIGMHGGGVGSGDARSSSAAYDSAASKLGWVALFPEVLEKTETGWNTSGTEEFVLELVDRARRTFDIDPDRVYFSGHSMGGFGSWTLGAHHADRVAALAPSAGAPTPFLNADGAVDGIAPGVIPSLRNVPMVIYQSGDDPQVPPAANDEAVRRLDEAREKWGGYEYEYWREERRGHDLPPGGMKALLEKIEDRERVARPDKLVWQPALPWKRQFYWLRWSAPRIGTIVEAELDREANSVRIAMNAPPTGLAVLVDDELLDTEREVVVVVNGDEVWRGVPQPALAALVATGAKGDGPRTYSAWIPLGE